ncbi:uncharacterized protein MONOS_14687 [Monocercomonoides exilis]|uniref:uncharacterized protein n=1 Tax=Monocercomonoides exilis TaxID=2049356 RepID=UPI003559B452|nr:hypothetical protein MONOS_14687 [Monocercomonoides exilis]|eukprot:MONOS_14687.1-p1 / transcript=MONOS_14687.1 / gene=MONOS_14687 / organism=Monocercomonoides_exilis_PA203 / gene_product=unspecified product / transcript_product=unspecified product / location=Mono_scaffold01051:7383-9429(-) / protein_length=648 / sequence_SO=supercontig / SO=protein_coding / is_pseudo=false
MQNKNQKLTLFSMPTVQFEKMDHHVRDGTKECIVFMRDLQEPKYKQKLSLLDIKSSGNYHLPIPDNNQYTIALSNCELRSGRVSVSGSFLNPGSVHIPSYEIPLPIYYYASTGIWALLTVYSLIRVIFFHSLEVGCILHWTQICMCIVHVISSLLRALSIDTIPLYRRERPLWFRILLEIVTSIGCVIPIVFLWLGALGSSVTHRKTQKTSWAAIVIVSLASMGFRMMMIFYDKMTFIALIIILFLLTYHWFSNVKTNKTALQNQLLLSPLHPMSFSLPFRNRLTFFSRLQFVFIVYAAVRCIYLIFFIALPQPLGFITLIMDDFGDLTTIVLCSIFFDIISFGKAGETELRNAIAERRRRAAIFNANANQHGGERGETNLFQGIDLNHVTFMNRISFRAKKNGLYLRVLSQEEERRVEEAVHFEELLGLEEDLDEIHGEQEGNDDEGDENGRTRNTTERRHQGRQQRRLTQRERRALVDEIDIDIERQTDTNSPAAGLQNGLLFGDFATQNGRNRRRNRNNAGENEREREQHEMREINPLLHILMLMGELTPEQGRDEIVHEHQEHHRRRNIRENAEEHNENDENDSSEEDESNSTNESEDSLFDEQEDNLRNLSEHIELIDQLEIPPILVVSIPSGIIVTATNEK